MNRPVLVLLFVGVVLFGAGLAFAPENPPDDFRISVHEAEQEFPNSTAYTELPPSAQSAFDRALAQDSNTVLYNARNKPAFDYARGFRPITVNYQGTPYTVNPVPEENPVPVNQFFASLTATLGGALIAVYGGYRAVQ